MCEFRKMANFQPKMQIYEKKDEGVWSGKIKDKDVVTQTFSFYTGQQKIKP